MTHIRPQSLSFILGLIFVILLGIKFTELVRSGPFIESELVAPETLSPTGILALQNAFAPCDQKNPYSSAQEQKALERTRKLYCADNNSQSQIDWIKKQSYIAQDSSVWRGRYLHHYSTILFPYREILAGNIDYAFTSQYGFISLTPLFFMYKAPFTMYGGFGLLLLLGFGICVLYKVRESKSDALIVGGILILIAVVTYVPAIRMAPGFSFVRYLPLALLIYLADLQLRGTKNLYCIFAIVLALINSIQFNILFVAIASASYALDALNQKKWNGANLYTLPVAVGLVAIFQIILYELQSNVFTPALFSSVGEGERSIFYNALIFSFPFACKFFSSPGFARPSFDSQEILGIVTYILCASYTTSFLGSPQHYAGFLIMTFYSIFILARKYGLTNKKILLVFAVLLLVPIHNPTYLNIGKKFFFFKNSLVEYKNDIGSQIFFRSSMDLDKMRLDYEDVTKIIRSSDQVYFISKDKIFLEAYLNKNIAPAVYDIYTNYHFAAPIQALAKLNEEGALYLVLDSPHRRAYMNEFLLQTRTSGNHRETENHLKLLKSIDTLASELNSRIIKCNISYCVYSLK